ncbi:MAG: tRNA epoxyqueuosine(34) reductase QueG, partial [Verrucomicrobiota bacterium]|nr:tRNA epoxyqueuosine(34) reductase QueG [Verrucomicrobiota bacterium]
MKNRTSEIRHRIKVEANNLGFDSLGVTSVPVNLREDYYRDWIAKGKNGSMKWMETNNDRRLHPERLIPEARSILV